MSTKNAVEPSRPPGRYSDRRWQDVPDLVALLAQVYDYEEARRDADQEAPMPEGELANVAKERVPRAVLDRWQGLGQPALAAHDVALTLKAWDRLPDALFGDLAPVVRGALEQGEIELVAEVRDEAWYRYSDRTWQSVPQLFQVLADVYGYHKNKALSEFEEDVVDLNLVKMANQYVPRVMLADWEEIDELQQLTRQTVFLILEVWDRLPPRARQVGAGRRAGLLREALKLDESLGVPDPQIEFVVAIHLIFNNNRQFAYIELLRRRRTKAENTVPLPSNFGQPEDDGDDDGDDDGGGTPHHVPSDDSFVVAYGVAMSTEDRDDAEDDSATAAGALATELDHVRKWRSASFDASVSGDRDNRHHWRRVANRRWCSCCRDYVQRLSRAYGIADCKSIEKLADTLSQTFPSKLDLAAKWGVGSSAVSNFRKRVFLTLLDRVLNVEPLTEPVAEKPCEHFPEWLRLRRRLAADSGNEALRKAVRLAWCSNCRPPLTAALAAHEVTDCGVRERCLDLLSGCFLEAEDLLAAKWGLDQAETKAFLRQYAPLIASVLDHCDPKPERKNP